jgi:hypothetical protein
LRVSTARSNREKEGKREIVRLQQLNGREKERDAILTCTCVTTVVAVKREKEIES